VVGCVEALAEERALLLCYWLVHRPPGPTPLLLALRLLHALAITPPAAWAAAAQGGVVYLLTVLLPAKPATPEFKVPSMWSHPVFSCTASALPLYPYTPAPALPLHFYIPDALCLLRLLISAHSIPMLTPLACMEWCGYVECSIKSCCHGCCDIGQWAAPWSCLPLCDCLSVLLRQAQNALFTNACISTPCCRCLHCTRHKVC